MPACIAVPNLLSMISMVDIGTVATVPLNAVVYLSKIMENSENFVDKVIASALVTTYWVITRGGRSANEFR
jgi:hypothetical protein